jgi:DEAD/DEAH box helicase domain-containing protein
MSEPRDLGRAVGDGAATWSAVLGGDGRGSLRTLEGASLEPDADARRFRPTLHLYDNYPGGIGLSAPLFAQRDALVGRARDLVEACPCLAGCPACVGPVLAPREGLGAKQAALVVLGLLAGRSSVASGQPGEGGHGPH